MCIRDRYIDRASESIFNTRWSRLVKFEKRTLTLINYLTTNLDSLCVFKFTHGLKAMNNRAQNIYGMSAMISSSDRPKQVTTECRIFCRIVRQPKPNLLPKPNSGCRIVPVLNVSQTLKCLLCLVAVRMFSLNDSLCLSIYLEAFIMTLLQIYYE